jgi:hypothetical protein
LASHLRLQRRRHRHPSRQKMPLGYVPTATAAGRRMRFSVIRCGWSLHASSPHFCGR